MRWTVLVSCCWLAATCSATLAASTCDNEDHLVADAVFLPPVSCTGGHISGALQAQVNCNPRPEVIQLPWPNNTDIQQMTPTHITVSRCSGGCHQLSQSCIPKKIRMKKVPVLLAKCGISRGKCDKECASVEIEEHLDCGCHCAIKEEDCTPEQVYVKETCACKCRDQEEARMCQESGRVWNPSTCSCRCPVSSLQQCSTGLVYDHNNTCSCIPIMSNEIPEQRIERSSAKFFLSWEIITIGVLLSTLFLLMVLTLTLVRRLYTIKQRLKSSQVLLPSSLTKGLYVPCSDPCTDLSLPNKVNIKNVLPSDEENCCDRQTDSSMCCDRQTDSSMCCDSMSSSSSEHRNYMTSCPADSPRVGPVVSKKHFTPQHSGTDSVRRHKNVLLDNSEAYGSLKGHLESIKDNKLLGDGGGGDNTVQIVYKNGSRTMELNCHIDPVGDEPLRITENPFQEHKYC